MTNALVQNKTFQSVDISVKCPISNETGNAMAETLKHNLTLTALANPAPLQPQKLSWRTLRSQKAQPYKKKQRVKALQGTANKAFKIRRGNIEVCQAILERVDSSRPLRVRAIFGTET